MTQQNHLKFDVIRFEGKGQKEKLQIQLVKEAFTSSEASDILCALLDEKINFHKLQRLTIREGNHYCKTGQLDDRIRELEQEKETAREFIAANRELERGFKITGTLEITFAE